MLLAERLRNPDEKRVIKEVLEKHMKNVKIDEEGIYSRFLSRSDGGTDDGSDTDGAFFRNLKESSSFGSMVWNQSMRRYL